MNTKAKRVGPFQRTKSEQDVTAKHVASKKQPRSDTNKSSRREPNSKETPYQPTGREQIVHEHAAGATMNTNAKSFCPLPRTKCEEAVIANHSVTKMQQTNDTNESSRREPNSEEARYRPTAREQSVLERHAARQEAAAPAPRIKVQYDGHSKPISIDHPDPHTALALLAEALGTDDVDFVEGLLDQLIAVSSPYGEFNEVQLNFMLSVIKGIKPTDQLEAMLAAQMALLHTITMRSGWKLARTALPSEQENESVLREINRAARTFMGQLEALKRYRSGGEQKVTVQQVFSVNEGGQAIGNVNQAPREGTPELADARQPAMEMVGKSDAAPVRRRQNNGRPSST